MMKKILGEGSYPHRRACYEHFRSRGLYRLTESSFTYYYFLVGITIFETVMLSPFMSPVSRTV